MKAGRFRRPQTMNERERTVNVNVFINACCCGHGAPYRTHRRQSLICSTHNVLKVPETSPAAAASPAPHHCAQTRPRPQPTRGSKTPAHASSASNRRQPVGALPIRGSPELPRRDSSRFRCASRRRHNRTGTTSSILVCSTDAPAAGRATALARKLRASSATKSCRAARSNPSSPCQSAQSTASESMTCSRALGRPSGSAASQTLLGCNCNGNFGRRCPCCRSSPRGAPSSLQSMLASQPPGGHACKFARLRARPQFGSTRDRVGSDFSCRRDGHTAHHRAGHGPWGRRPDAAARVPHQTAISKG
eukprot:6529318-Prymnesium_polylepis.1